MAEYPQEEQDRVNGPRPEFGIGFTRSCIMHLSTPANFIPYSGLHLTIYTKHCTCAEYTAPRLDSFFLGQKGQKKGINNTELP